MRRSVDSSNPAAPDITNSSGPTMVSSLNLGPGLPRRLDQQRVEHLSARAGLRAPAPATSGYRPAQRQRH